MLEDTLVSCVQRSSPYVWHASESSRKLAPCHMILHAGHPPVLIPAPPARLAAKSIVHVLIEHLGEKSFGSMTRD